ncbi:MAG: penicillin acylase family protein [Bacteroidia bacterium]|nr:penicillin acylase family protein [Bacteroidia bacterium]
MSAFHTLLGKILKPVLSLYGKSKISRVNCTYQVTGAQQEIEVRRDPEGVPHIYAQSLADLAFGQGFVHAQDRMWQMEVNRRLAAGRVAEVFGEVALETDRLTRTLGFRENGTRDVERLPQNLRDLLQNYCNGINAYLNHPKTRLPIEFSLAGYKPEPWKMEDVLIFSRMMVFQMSLGWVHELVRAQLVEAFGEELAAELDVAYPKDNPPTIPKGIETRLLQPDGKFRAFTGPFMKQMKGSNAWAVTGEKTDTGMPYLCNDPHLPMLLPGIWYQNHLECPELRSIGVSLPGLPLVLIGHNAHIAWGVTLSFTDIQDLFVEQFEDKSLKRYKFKGEWLDSVIREEEIRIKGRKEAFVERVVTTHHGPVVTDVIDFEAKQQLALNSTCFGEAQALKGWYGLNLAQNWDDFVTSLSHIEAPGLNIAYADVEGNIGYWVTGSLPVRAQGEGRMPTPGWTGEHEWTGFVPFAEMPHVLNPEAGYVITCNHKIVPDDYPHFLGRTWMNGYRARRLEDLFAGQKVFGKEDFKQFHHDFYCLPGVEFKKHFAGLKVENTRVHAALEKLVNWDGMLTVDSVGGALYEVVKTRMTHLLLESRLGKEKLKAFLGRGLNAVMLLLNEYMGYETVVLLRWLEEGNGKWLEMAGGKEKVLQKSLEEAVEWLEAKLGKNMDGWAWGRLHKVEFPHAMGVVKPLDRVFNVGPLPIGGDTDTVCQTAFRPQEPYEGGLTCPSYRQIVDMSNLDQSLWIMPPGQSGQLGSRHYSDQVQGWIDGKYYPMRWERETVEKATVEIMKLVL